MKDAVIFADETSSRRIAAAGEPLTLNLSPTSSAGAPKSISVTGLPDGLAYDNASGVVSGASEKVGTFKITTTIVSAAGQKLRLNKNAVVLYAGIDGSGSFQLKVNGNAVSAGGTAP